mgnify:CR=1 FL=1
MLILPLLLCLLQQQTIPCTDMFVTTYSQLLSLTTLFTLDTLLTIVYVRYIPVISRHLFACPVLHTPLLRSLTLPPS